MAGDVNEIKTPNESKDMLLHFNQTPINMLPQ